MSEPRGGDAERVRGAPEAGEREETEEETMQALVIPWFIWSLVTPGGSYKDADLRWEPVRQFESEAKCRTALPAYEREAAKAYPTPAPEPGQTSRWVTWPTARLRCSPVNPGSAR